MDFNAIAQQLIDAIKAQSTAGIAQLGQSRRNDFSTIMNRANAKGTLYSTDASQQKTKYDANTYLPKLATLQATPLNSELSIRTNLAETQAKIDAINKSASQLNGLSFDDYGVIA